VPLAKFNFGPFEIEWPATRIAELDERIVGGETLTAAEETERQDLRRRYPQDAAKADRLDHLYLYSVRKEAERADPADISSGNAYVTAGAKCERLKDPTKISYVDLSGSILTKIRRFESLRFDGLLTPEEAKELDELHRLYPRRAEQVRNFINRRLSEDAQQRVYRRQSGHDSGPIEQGKWPRPWTSPADNARSRTPEPDPLDDDGFMLAFERQLAPG
jgi:uncharacterized protein YnzC (UPF0291/DUF896 family)